MAVLRIVLLALAAFAVFDMPARADVTLQRIDTDRGVVILIKGAFALSDDPQALTREISATGARIVTFDSDGGNVVSAIAYGRIIRSLGLSSFQLRATQCASACALAFVGGVVRHAEPGAIGVHQSSFSADTVLDGHLAVAAVQQMTAQIMTYLLEMGVDPKLLQLSLSVPPNDMRYLTAAEMGEYKVTAGMNSTVPETLSSASTMPTSETTAQEEKAKPLTNEDKALAFVSAYYKAWSRGNAEALVFMDRAYNETVGFYGKPRSRIYVVDEKVKFVMRWPVRAYNVKPGTATVSCAAYCVVTGIVDWYAKRDVGYGLSSGSARFLLSWDPSTGKIAAESGEVLDTDKDAVAPIRIFSQWYDQNAICRGTAGDAETSVAACTHREIIATKLKTVGYCYGEDGQAGYQMDWHRCGSKGQVQDFATEGLSSKANRPHAARYAATERFTGRTKLPDFRGRDRKFNSFRTRIKNGMREGPNFAGHFSVIQIGCGTGCSFAFVGDNNTGRPADFPRGGEENTYMQLQFETGSRLLAAQWLNFSANKCFIEFFDYDHTRWNLISKVEVGAAEACYRPVAENLR
ncbi:MAG TPA: hypothetical protein VGN93_04135 [Shinella sp.]|jgi:hypothetical protein|uniref:COG3904 family protein n=1 Tax=Shinella sp. TaxID=1870904 RepID=UPI002E1154A2|nr:hypothetical protein [Shinella sp.]